MTKKTIEQEGHHCILISGDIAKEEFCKRAVQKVIDEFGRLDIVVNNAAVQYPRDSISKISKKQLYKTFETNVFSQFYITKAALKYLKKNSVIINTTSVTAYRGSEQLLDYSSTNKYRNAYSHIFNGFFNSKNSK